MPKLPRKTSDSRISKIVNEIGEIREQIDKLQEREAILKAKLLNARIVEYQSNKFKVTVSCYTKLNIDYDALLDHLKVSSMLKNRFARLKSVTALFVKKVEK